MSELPDDFFAEDNVSPAKEDISKTRRKKHSTELQKIGEELLSLNKRQLELIEVSEPLLSALREYQRIPPRHEARRRQLQYIGKLMRAADHESIRAALEKLRTPDRQEVRRSQEIERWGERLLSGTADDIEAFVEAWPIAERQPLRTLMRRFQQLSGQLNDATDDDSAPTPASDDGSADSDQSKAARRRLFDYIKGCIQ
ncbi:MAG: ribosome biogenesis factor YjgA [Pseudohongiella sp.]|nr:ribosome biogenesis factor YjgA [Pseudohongiella sp.]MDO9520837.1 ribosome biogenesis factor YjgA [Pseudohongiella sp.]MDP2128100.1 ribosome biogenesis factor YjgA [Pseudohongiella sp.]